MALPFFPYCALGTAAQAFTPRGSARDGRARCAKYGVNDPDHDTALEGCNPADVIELGDFGINQTLVSAVLDS
jgi:hypothetical protein